MHEQQQQASEQAKTKKKKWKNWNVLKSQYDLDAKSSWQEKRKTAEWMQKAYKLIGTWPDRNSMKQPAEARVETICK